MGDARLRPRVLVVDRAPDLTRQLRRALTGPDRPEFVQLANTTRLPSAFADEGPWDAVVAGPSEESRAGLRRLADIREADPSVGLLVTVNGKDPADLGAFVKARPDELVRVPATGAGLRAALETTLAAAGERRTAAAGEPAAPAAPATRAGVVYSVGGPTGGCGKTTVATSLAAMLARDPETKVVLVDLDLQFGEVTAALQLRVTTTLFDVLFDETDSPVDEAAVSEGLAATLTPTRFGFQVLPAPTDPAQADLIGSDEIDRLLTQLRSQADYVVIDQPTGLREVALAALDHSDHLVVVSQVDVPGLANLRSYMTVLDRLGVTDRTIVLNKEMADSGVTGADAVEVLGPVAATLPLTLEVVRALNEGRPFWEMAPHHPVAESLQQALAPLLPAAAVPPPQAARPSGQTRSRWLKRRRTT